jgi:hypothetical protein
MDADTYNNTLIEMGIFFKNRSGSDASINPLASSHFRFRHSRRRHGYRSAYKTILASRASFSNPSSTVSPGATSDTTSASPA